MTPLFLPTIGALLLLAALGFLAVGFIDPFNFEF